MENVINSIIKLKNVIFFIEIIFFIAHNGFGLDFRAAAEGGFQKNSPKIKCILFHYSI